MRILTKHNTAIIIIFLECTHYLNFSDSVDYQYPSLVDLDSETHGGDDVMVFARGPWAHLFTGNYEQNEIPIAMAMAAGISTDFPTVNSKSNAAIRCNFAEQTIFVASLLLALIGIF